MYRIGHGFDVHPFKKGRKLILGGVEFESEFGLDGHSDADVILHAVMDAILGALGERDIGHHFPPSDEKYKNISSRKLLKIVATMLEESEYEIGNIDITVHAEKPKIARKITEMRANIADDLGCAIERINIKATTWEGLGYVGRGEGIAADALALLKRRSENDDDDFENIKSLKAKRKSKSLAESREKEELLDFDEPTEKRVKTKGAVVIYTDGASKGNPGPAGAGAVIIDGKGDVISEISMFLGNMTNNQAEYQALILALKEVAGLRPERLIIKSDSQLMVRQLSGEYKVKDMDLFALFNLVQRQLKMIQSWEIEHIPRDENNRADKLANDAIKEK